MEEPMSIELSVTQQPPSILKLLAHEIRWKLLALLARSDYCVQELVGFLHQPQNLVSYHLRQLRDENVVPERRSSADARDNTTALILPRCAHSISPLVKPCILLLVKRRY